jgi:hypothetical protein
VWCLALWSGTAGSHAAFQTSENSEQEKFKREGYCSSISKPRMGKRMKTCRGP